jgi:hypothetical protein
MKKIKKLIISVSFQIGVNVIGLPEIITHDLTKTIINKSKFHR